MDKLDHRCDALGKCVAPVGRLKTLKWILLVGLLVRLPGLFGTLWYDETFTLWLAGLSLPDLLAATAGDVHPPLWYIVEWLTVRALGNSEWALRLPALILGLLAVWLMYGVLSRIQGIPDPVRTLALWFTALSPMLVHYSAEARMYSLFAVMVLWSMDNALAGRYIWLGVSMALGMYTHNMFALYVPVFVFTAASKTPVIYPLSSIGIAGALYLPWLPTLLHQAQNVNSAYWIPPLNFGRISYIVYRLINGPGHHEYIVLITAPLLLTAALTGSYLAWKSAHLPTRSPAHLLLWAWFPIILGAVISHVIAPVLIERVVIGSAPALLTLIAWSGWWVYQHLGRWYLLPITGALAIGLFTVMTTTIRDDVLGRYQQLPVQAGDSCYHLNASTLITTRYALPQCNHSIWPSENALDQSITQQTKTAMGMAQQPIEALSGLVWLFHYTGPHVQGLEYAEQRRILSAHPARATFLLDNDRNIAVTQVWRLELQQ
ncbi:MAG: hypothetical protein DRJ03_16315 [Chloroflexi bacterium]|nr:MAG: hypothetical protein DRI81_13555 [Chloroflexota bacterium]RLC83714.1 MAG: hypothetical protein DRJ03_16315 [Chloroflexota bacterium]